MIDCNEVPNINRMVGSAYIHVTEVFNSQKLSIW